MQKNSSKNTSINVKHLPAIYSKINWKHYSHFADNYSVIDIGCGRLETQKLIQSELKKHGIQNFYPWDPYHECIVLPIVSEYHMANLKENKVVVCTNVLNVIDDDNSLESLIEDLCNIIVVRLPDGTYRMNPCYITVYEGNRSGIGRETKKDCWQRNEKLKSYLPRFNNYIKKKYDHNSNFFQIKYGMIIGCCQYSSRWQ